MPHHPAARRRSPRALLSALAALLAAPLTASCRAEPPPPAAPATPAALAAERARADALKATLALPPAAREEALRRLLTPIEFSVTQRAGTERPFTGALWDQRAPGLYVDVISGEPLFSSAHKFDSGTGWPSFDRALSPAQVVEVEDRSLGETRVEVRAAASGAHLGHVFDDGPAATTGRRFCMNSAALRFVPLEALEREGYGAWQARAGLKATEGGE